MLINYTLQIYQPNNNSFEAIKISAPEETPLVAGTTIQLDGEHYFVYESDLLHGELEAQKTTIIEIEKIK